MMVIFMICLLVPTLSMMLVLLQVMITLVALITLVPVTMADTLGMARGKVASSKDAEAVCSGAASIHFHDADSGRSSLLLLPRRLRKGGPGTRGLDEKHSENKRY